MKPIRMLRVIAVLLLAAPVSAAQGRQAEPAKAPAQQTTDQTPLKVQVVLTEFDGARKISSLPYSLDLLGTGTRDRQWAHLRYGVRVPVAIAYSSNGGNNITYQDVGTNIDCQATQRPDGTYLLDMTAERSSVSTPTPSGTETEWKPGNAKPSEQPLNRSFRDNFAVVSRNGQTVEGVSATDPVTGHVLKIDVTLTVLK